MNRIMMNNAMDSLHEALLEMGGLCERGIDEVLAAVVSGIVYRRAVTHKK